MDTGKNPLQIQIAVDSDINAAILHDRLSFVGADLVLQTLEGWLQGPFSQSHNRPAHSPSPN
jgi:methionyl-tRNA formyltransferase